MKKGEKFFLTALIASITGYVAGILTAPKSGKETRKDIHDKAQKAKIDSEKKLRELYGELTATIKTVEAKARTLKGTAKGELTELLDKAVGVKERTKHVISSVREGDNDDQDLQQASEDIRKAIDHLKSYVDKHAKELKK